MNFRTETITLSLYYTHVHRFVTTYYTHVHRFVTTLHGTNTVIVSIENYSDSALLNTQPTHSK